uniref:Vacuolar sorting protein 39/Transforming growth factor beta receptor-associated zinc finger domain-containing protein n=1 Tax=Alexandrium catenella TaxID=2925 RepID=A0A7S1WGG0_ALECA
MCSALKSASSHAGGAELLRHYVPELLKLDPSAVLPVFAGPPVPGSPTRCPLNPDEVLQLLEGHDAVILGYLEHLVASKRDVEPQHHAQLALMYISQVASERSSAEAEATGLSPTRQRLLRFLEEAEGVDARNLLPRVEALGLHEERVALHCREQQHREALRILVVALNDLPRAETYCRVIMAQQQRRQASATASGPAAGVAAGPRISVFSTDSPPVWARPVAFAPRRGGEDEEPTAAFTPGPRPGATAAETGGERPLMAFFMVLLDASAGAAQQPGEYRKVPAEYRESALALLTTYAGHRDLPPEEVVAMLPADWTLESLAGYLSKCARICLHEQRVSMLEKKLSSMAYLKTFSALAHERSRKVTISGDRCCPVCNRRFVDKDSVGKAFVAYPNETCVHLQCKEDISVCPKTGVSFADNLSVYCNALGGMDLGGLES